MHIHSINFQVAGIASGAAVENEVARQRAIEVRRRLLKIASDLEVESSPEESFLVDRWMGAQHDPETSEDKYSASAGAENQVEEETDPDDSVELRLTSNHLGEIA